MPEEHWCCDHDAALTSSAGYPGCQPPKNVCLYKAERTKTEAKQVISHSLPLGELGLNLRKKKKKKVLLALGLFALAAKRTKYSYAIPIKGSPE
jgi:hypothetical protein